MDSIELIRAFRAVAAHGSVSQAAQSLRLSKGTLSKYVARLEAEHGVRLLERNTRGMALTEAGRVLVAQGGRLVRADEALRRALRACVGQE